MWDPEWGEEATTERGWDPALRQAVRLGEPVPEERWCAVRTLAVAASVERPVAMARLGSSPQQQAARI